MKRYVLYKHFHVNDPIQVGLVIYGEPITDSTVRNFEEIGKAISILQLNVNIPDEFKYEEEYSSRILALMGDEDKILSLKELINEILINPKIEFPSKKLIDEFCRLLPDKAQELLE